jgi:hypothetical protein
MIQIELTQESIDTIIASQMREVIDNMTRYLTFRPEGGVFKSDMEADIKSIYKMRKAAIRILSYYEFQE